MIFFPLSRGVERLVRLGFVSFKLCACQGLALLLCSQMQLDLSLALLFFPLLFSLLASKLYIHFGFPVVSAPRDCPELRGSIKDILKNATHVSVCGCAWHGCVPQCMYRCQRTCAPWFSPLGWNSGCWVLTKSLPAEPSCWPRSSTIRLDWHTPCKAGISVTACENKAGVMWKSVSNSTRGKPWQYDDWVWETAQCPCE